MSLDPKGAQPSVILVNLTSWTKRKEQTVVLTPDDYPAITKKLVVHYFKASVVGEVLAERLFRNPLPRVSDDTLRKIIAGFLRSEQVPVDVKKFYMQTI